MRRISTHISYREATKSQTAERLQIDNTPEEATLNRMRLVAAAIFEPVRLHFGVPIYISSFYRSPVLNRAIGGSDRSQHVKGEAIDMDADIFGGVTNKQIFEYIKKYLDYDQLLWEYGDDNNPAWVHCSYKKEGNRKQVLYIRR